MEANYRFCDRRTASRGIVQKMELIFYFKKGMLVELQLVEEKHSVGTVCGPRNRNVLSALSVQ